MIYFQDNTIRDGMQQHLVSKSFTVKKKVIEEISKTKINSVEIGMCDTSQDLQMLSEYMSILRKDQTGIVLTRLIESSIDLGAALASKFPNTVLKLLVPISQMHIEEKLKTDQVIYLRKLDRILKYAEDMELKIDIVLEDATRADINYLIDAVSIISKYKVGFVTLADTVGCSTPSEYGRLFSNINKHFPKMKLSAHCHNDLGLATANTLSAIQNGASQVEVTFLGIGERAGNSAIEEIVAILQKKKIAESELTLPSLVKTSKKVQEILGYDISPTMPIIGKNIFVHESGIHQDGTLKNIEMYQYILPNELEISDDIEYPVSGISSKKILRQYFKKYLTSDEDIESLIVMYRNISKVTDKFAPEDCVALYQLNEGKQNENNKG